MPQEGGSRPRQAAERLRRADVGGLELIDLRKGFDEVVALDGLSLTVKPGRMVGFLGPNGAGKTTAMRSVFELVELDAGQVLWDGRPIGLAERLEFGYMPEERGLYPRMQVGEQIEYFGRLHGLDAGRARAAAARWLERLGLEDRPAPGRGSRTAASSARSSRQRWCTSRSSSCSTSRSRASTRWRCSRSQRCSAARRSAAPPSSSPVISSLVEDICEEVAIVDHGRIVATGDVDGLRRASQHRRIELQLDDAPPEWLPDVSGVELVERRNGSVRLLAGRDVDPEQLLAAAERAGRVVAFSYGPPSLAELFMELVAP